MMRTLKIYLCFFLLIPSCMAEECSLSQGGKGTISVIKGHYVTGMELSSFKSCDEKQDGPWWLYDAPEVSSVLEVLEEDLIKIRAAKPDYEMNKVFIRAKACVSNLGQYGHMRMYTRQADMLTLLEHRPPTTKDCD